MWVIFLVVTATWLAAADGSKSWSISPLGRFRDDPTLVSVVEELGPEASGSYSELKVVEIPDDVDWKIVEHDGKEHVAEKHRTWC